MVNLSPDTNAEGPWNSGYCYHKDSLSGFSHVHAWELSVPIPTRSASEERKTTYVASLAPRVSMDSAQRAANNPG